MGIATMIPMPLGPLIARVTLMIACGHCACMAMFAMMIYICASSLFELHSQRRAKLDAMDVDARGASNRKKGRWGGGVGRERKERQLRAPVRVCLHCPVLDAAGARVAVVVQGWFFGPR